MVRLTGSGIRPSRPRPPVSPKTYVSSWSPSAVRPRCQLTALRTPSTESNWRGFRPMTCTSRVFPPKEQPVCFVSPGNWRESVSRGNALDGSTYTRWNRSPTGLHTPPVRGVLQSGRRMSSGTLRTGCFSSITLPLPTTPTTTGSSCSSTGRQTPSTRRSVSAPPTRSP